MRIGAVVPYHLLYHHVLPEMGELESLNRTEKQAKEGSEAQTIPSSHLSKHHCGV
jgi:hypothetical protein